MDFDTPETRPSSWLVPYFGIASAAIVVVTIALLLAMSQSIFPTSIHDTLESGLATTGSTQAKALAQLGTIRTRELSALAANGVPRQGVVEGSVDTGHDKKDGYYWASQTLRVPADDYPRFARLSNRINRLKDPDFSLSFPQLPFQNALVSLFVVAFIVGSISTVALETRKADVSRSPKGMHPAIVAIQTLMYGVIVALAIFYIHLLGDGIGGAFLAVEGIFIASLAIWLYRTRRSWTQSNGYRVARFGYLAALLACAIVVALAFAQPAV
ncbi:MAG TPA: hypothetical protein VIG46_00135 [Candidatus Baltobacteraceae bacterium]